MLSLSAGTREIGGMPQLADKKGSISSENPIIHLFTCFGLNITVPGGKCYLLINHSTYLLLTSSNPANR